jgi:hypothetical protein
LLELVEIENNVSFTDSFSTVKCTNSIETSALTETSKETVMLKELTILARAAGSAGGSNRQPRRTGPGSPGRRVGSPIA